VEANIRPFFGHIKVSRLTTETLKEYRRKRVKEKRSEATCNRELSILVTIQPNLKTWLAPFARPKRKVEPPNSAKLLNGELESRNGRPTHSGTALRAITSRSFRMLPPSRSRWATRLQLCSSPITAKW